MDREDIQSRRAANQVWNGAENYDVRPEFQSYDSDGEAQLYFNTIIGLVYRYYQFDRFKPLFHTFQHQPKGELYSDLFWLGLEGAAYHRALSDRPVLQELRQDYARRVVKEAHAADPQSAESLHAAWFRRALGQPEQEDAWQKDVLDALTFDPAWDEQQIMDRMEALLYQYFHRARRSVTDRQWSMWVGRSIGKGRRTSRFVQPNALRRLEQSGGGPDEEETGKKRPHPLSFLQGRTPELILRRYVEDCFGVSMLTPPELAQVERELCTGVHKNCRLHFTKGEPVKHELGRETAWDVETFRQQRKKNRAYYQAHLVENKLIIAQLTQKLQNTILLQSDVSVNLARAGQLYAPIAWRSAALEEEKVFVQRQQSELGDLTVDILLDGSASQNRQQEKLSTQAYLIAESLERCRIPVRVTEFCSVSGCTVLRILRDYDQRGRNDAIFDYVAAGWNRDGLALRAMGWLMRRSRSDHRLLIILSDASPNDDQRIPIGALPLGGYVYSGKRGIQDTATEAGLLRRQGITPVCVFTGSDLELEGGRKIYGKALTRIPTIGWFADAVSKLIQGQIRQL